MPPSKKLSAGRGAGVEPPTKFSKVGGLKGPWFLEGVNFQWNVGGGGGGGCNFQIKKN